MDFFSSPQAVGGIHKTALAWWASRQAPSWGSSTLWILKNEEEADSFLREVESFSSAQNLKLGPWVRLPGWDRSPFSAVSPAVRTRQDRAAAINTVRSLPVTHVITTLEGASTLTIDPELHKSLTLTLSVGPQTIERLTLAQRLQDSGYLRADPVEDPGTFCVRGEILDIYPVEAEKPYRIEFFDSDVEAIRVFDPKTQRTLGDRSSGISSVTLAPAREVVFAPEVRERLKARTKERADTLGIPRLRRDPWLSAIEDGVIAPHSEFWAGWAYRDRFTAMDHFSSPPRVVFVEAEQCKTEFKKRFESLSEQSQDHWSSEAIAKASFVVPKLEDIVLQDAPLKGLELERLVSAQAKPIPHSGFPHDAELPLALRHVAKTAAKGDRDARLRVSGELRRLLKQGFSVSIFTSTQSQAERARTILEEEGLTPLSQTPPAAGLLTLHASRVDEPFVSITCAQAVLTEEEILGVRPTSRAKRSRSESALQEWSGLNQLSDLVASDLVVHIDHGIGRYRGLVRLELMGAAGDFLLIEYAGGDKLYLPIYRLDRIQKYAGAGGEGVLDKLGSQQFARAKDKVREAVRALAVDLVKLYAERALRPGMRISPPDHHYLEFESRFPFEETPDQIKAIHSIAKDLESGRPLDRLVCGDVGFGKTEVAIRAAFRVGMDSKQVLVLVPTTLLAHQHLQTFRTRLESSPLTVEGVSRFKSGKEQKEILSRFAAGKVDILIGTHRLLSQDVKPQQLGLVIIDEEHRFGVEHKEKLKTLKLNTHVLTLTATPIPRTLHMALSGIRDISVMSTPPIDRLPIRTQVSRYDEEVIQQAIEQELSRGGQVFFVFNRVEGIENMRARLQTMFPEVPIGVAHGQMPEGALEKVMLEFYEKRLKILVCTTIVESGLDLPSANTMIIHRADMFGLAQLYQLRGRVGRGEARAYCTLLLPEEGQITSDAQKRLEVIQRFVELGSGFAIASHDLEIRGGGDLLGPSQSGHINAVGFELYTELLEEAIRELQSKPEAPRLEAETKDPEIKVPFAAYLDEHYVEDVGSRLTLYRKLSSAKDESDLSSLESELRERFGPLPLEAMNLISLIKVKQLLKRAGVENLTVGPGKIAITPGPASKLDPARAISLMASQPSTYQLLPDSRFVVSATCTRMDQVVLELERLLGRLLAGV